jgi:hypothetical protein
MNGRGRAQQPMHESIFDEKTIKQTQTYCIMATCGGMWLFCVKNGPKKDHNVSRD